VRAQYSRVYGVIAVVAVVCVILGTTPASPSVASGKSNHALAVAAGGLPANVKQECPPSPSAATMSCLALVRTDVPGHLGLMTGAPAGFGPAQLASAYNLASASASRGKGETVALVDAFDDPRAAADLATYRTQFGLPPCDKATGAGCLTKASFSSGAPLPRADKAWAAQESMDIDMVAAICPNCHTLLDESGLTFEPDLEGVPNAKFVSYGFAEPENPAFFNNISTFAQQDGVAIVVAAGDSGYGTEYPASSQFVTAVGGTSLVQDAGSARGWTESAWSDTSSGCSTEQFQPSWQSGVSAGCPMREGNDVSAVADPETGVAFYDSYQSGGWGVGGGTNVASAIITAIYALAGTPTPGTYPSSYPYLDPGGLNDITAGANGTCSPSSLCTAGPGYDGPTGLGSPNGIAAFGPGPSTKNVITLSAIEGTGLSLTVGHNIGIYFVQVLDSGSSPNLKLSVTGLPPGLAMTEDGGALIKGTPTSAGSFLVKLKAVDQTGASGTLTLPLTVYSNAITITAPDQESTPVGTAVTPVRIQAADSDTSQPLTFAVAHLPPGLSLTQTGPGTATISGTATTAGRYGGLITVTDSTGASQTARIGWGVFGTLAVGGQANRTSSSGDPVLLNFHATDSDPTAVLSYGFTTLPPGLGMDFDTGQISGWPSRPGVYHVTLLVNDNFGAMASRSLTWTVKAAPDAGPAGPLRLSAGNLCLDDKGNAKADGTVVEVTRCDNSPAQRWTVVKDGSLRIHGMCLDTRGHSLHTGAKAILWTCGSRGSQSWTRANPGQVMDIYAGRCLAAAGRRPSTGARVALANCGTASNQRWTLPSGPITSLDPGICVADPGNATASGTPIEIASCDGGADQDWNSAPDGTIRIHGQCIDYAKQGSAPKASIHLSRCTGTPTQQWSAPTFGFDGQLAPTLENKGASACLDDPQASTSPGTHLVIGSCPTWSSPLSEPGASWHVS
jgi:hypothetical protein